MKIIQNMHFPTPQDELDPIRCRGRQPNMESLYEKIRKVFLFLSFIFLVEKIIISMMYFKNFL